MNSKHFLSNALVVTLFVSFTYCSPLNFNENLELELVQVLFRHGARTQLGLEAELLKINENSVHPWGFAQLTTDGMRQEYEIGKMLRERYNGFLPALYNQRHVYAFSSGTGRTKASLELVLSALYPPEDEFVWNPNLNWMPIPIQSNPKPLDILNNPRSCPEFANLLNSLYNSTKFRAEVSKHDDVRKILENIYGVPFDLNHTWSIYNSLIAQKSQSRPMPEWYNDEIFSKLHDAAAFYLNTLSYDPELKRRNGGTYAKRLLENMNESNSSKGRRIYLYASHDKNLHAVAKFYDITLPRVPDHGSAIIVEKLRNKHGDRFVKFLFWSGNPKKLETLMLKDCAAICSMEQFVKIITPMLPSDNDMLCLFKNIQPKSLEMILNSDTGVEKV